MTAFKNSQILRWIAIAASFIIVTLILWNTYTFFQKFKEEERQKMETLGKAYERFAKNTDLDADIELERYIIMESNNTIPMIITDSEGLINSWSKLNVDDTKIFKALSEKDQKYL